MYYAVLVMSEIMGKSNASQVLDLNANNGNEFTPAYAIYENGTPTRVALFNYLDDSSGASDISVNVAIGGGTTGQANATPASVKVKYVVFVLCFNHLLNVYRYLLAQHVTSKGNFTWAGQTLGNAFQSDGRLMGQESIQTVACDQTANTCTVKVPAPGFALVFLPDQALSDPSSPNTQTFATTAYTKTINTVKFDPSVLATSNGHTGRDRAGKIGSTSQGSRNGAVARNVRTEDVVAGTVAVFVGVVGLAMGLF
jgi:Glycosyl hydrolase family 79 C-terminal beta domain